MGGTKRKWGTTIQQHFKKLLMNVGRRWSYYEKGKMRWWCNTFMKLENERLTYLYKRTCVGGRGRKWICWRMAIQIQNSFMPWRGSCGILGRVLWSSEGILWWSFHGKYRQCATYSWNGWSTHNSTRKWYVIGIIYYGRISKSTI